MKFSKMTVKLFAISTMLVGGSVLADPPMPNVFDGGNKWRISYYDDAVDNHNGGNKQDICFLPYAVVDNSIQGHWYSMTFSDFNGSYYQEGDEVKMTGDFGDDRGHTHMTLQHTTKDVPGKVRGIAFKDWTVWYEDGRYGVAWWGNAMMQRVGKCKFITGDVPGVPARLLRNGSEALSPAQDGQESLKKYYKRTRP